MGLWWALGTGDKGFKERHGLAELLAVPVGKSGENVLCRSGPTVLSPLTPVFCRGRPRPQGLPGKMGPSNGTVG